MKNRLFNLFTLFALLLSLVGSFASVTPAQAAGIVVNSNTDTVANDGVCTLREAITAANSDTTSGAAVGECAAGSGTDAITFAANYTITLGSQLPSVTTVITITGNGSANTIVQANAAANTATYRVFEVGAAGNLTLESLTARHGRCNGSCATSAFSGGGVLNSGSLTLTNVTLSDNSANFGAGVYNNSTLTVTNSTISGNSATAAAGGIYNTSIGTVTLTSSTLSGNSAPGGTGGGIDNNGTLTMTNTTLSNNSASYGGGIYNNGGTLTLTNSTLSGNSAIATFGGGIGNYGLLNYTNTIIANSTTGGDCVTSGGTIGTNTNNLVEGGTCSATLSGDPALGSLADNGGPTFTHALQAGSTAINAGTSSGAPATDQRGVSRPQNTSYDIGAYELLHCPAGKFDNGNAGCDFAPTGKYVPTAGAIMATPCPTGTYQDLEGQISCKNAPLGTFVDLEGQAQPTDCAVGKYQDEEGQTSCKDASVGYYVPVTGAEEETACPAGSTTTVQGQSSCVQTGGADDLVVNSSADTNDGACSITPGNCTLREAINAANTISGTDTITFAADYTITLGSQLPAVTTVMTLTGNGAANTIVQASTCNPVTTPGGCTPATYRVFRVSSVGNLTLDSLTIRHGRCNGSCSAPVIEGGGILNFGTLTLTNSTLSGNSANNGGGISNGGTLTVTNSTLSGNGAALYGGGILNGEGGTLTVTNSTLSGNSGPIGGGISNGGGSTLTVINSTLSANGGGGIYSNSGTVTVINSTLSANSDFGIYNEGTLNFANTIIANSTTGSDCVNSGGTIGTNTNNLVEDGTCSAALSGDPALGSLTGSPAYFPLNVGSPAINAGSNAICAAAPVSNQSQNGVTRPFGAACDIGSFEKGNANIDVTIGGVNQGNYTLNPSTSDRQAYAGINNGPARVSSTANILASTRVLFGNVSYSEMMGFPTDQLTNEYVFPYYNNTAMDSQLRVSNLGLVSTTINVYVGSSPTPIDTYTLAAGAATRKNYAGVNNGPMRVTSSATNIITTIRVLYGGLSYSELVGFPANQLTTEYIFPYYNNTAMDSQLRVSNMGGSTTTINVYVGSSPTPIDTYTLAAGAATRKNYAGVNNGPLKVTSSTTNILTTVRVLFGGLSYSELLGFPVNQLTTSYSYPVYDNVSIDSQLRVSNVGNATTTITVFSGSTQIDSYSLAAGAATRINYAAVNNGPLRVVSSTQPILTTTRMLYLTSGFSSFYEMTGMPDNQLHTEYVFPWYNNTAMDSQVRFALP